MMRKTSLILLGAAAGVALTLITTQPRIVFDGARAQAAAADTYRQLSLFGDVFERVRSDYVEKPDDGKLVESAINGMLAGLDPHSSYMDSKSFRDMQVQTRGEFGGLGIEVTMEDGLIKVVAPIDETPAAKAGIMANDIITHLDDEPVQGLTLNQAVEKMRGPVNTKVKLRIMRKGADTPIEMSLTRHPDPTAASSLGRTDSIGACVPLKRFALSRVVFGSSEGVLKGLSGIQRMITATPATSAPKPMTAYHACVRCSCSLRSCLSAGT